MAFFKGPLLRGGDPCRFCRALLVLFVAIAPMCAQDEEIDGSAWSGSLSVRVLSRLSQYGFDAAPEKLTFVAGGTIEHDAGVSIGLSSAVQPNPWTAQRTSLTGEYELTLSDVWNLGFSLIHSWYPASSTNPFAASPTSASVALSYDGEVWSFGADVDRYFGGNGATYASVDASLFIAGDGFNVLPIVSISFGSQTATSATLKRGNGRNTTLPSVTTTVTGLSSIDAMAVLVVPLGGGWSASAMPGFLYSPSDLASSSTRFTWSVGVRRSF